MIDNSLEEQYLTIRCSMCYNAIRKKTEVGLPQARKIRTVDFCNTLTDILRTAKKQQILDSINYVPLHRQNYYLTVKEKDRTYYEVYTLSRTENMLEDYHTISFICLRLEGTYESLSTVGLMCQAAKKK